LYYRGTEGVLLCFALTSRKSFENVPRWLQDLRDNTKELIPVVLVGTKYDLEGQEVTLHEGRKLAYDLNLPFFHTSAKLDLNIKDCVKHLAELLLAQQHTDTKSILQTSRVILAEKRPKKKCC